MASSKRKQHGKSSIDLIEEAIFLLRHNSPGFLILNFTGSFPFLLGLLYFWSDMSRGAYASERLFQGSFFTALLYVWMKCWHTVAATHLLHQISGTPPPKWNLKRVIKMVLFQCSIQPSALFLRPLAALATLPYGWAFAFFHNFTILGNGEEKLGPQIKEAWFNSNLWQKQNHLLIGKLTVLGFVLWLNIVSFLVAVPWLLKTFLAIETGFTHSPALYLNTTFFAITYALTFLCTDPIYRAAYTLRCFYGKSLKTGEDLKIAFRKIIPISALAAKMLVLVLLFNPALPLCAAEPAEQTISSEKLEGSISEVLTRQEYRWRMPRVDNEDETNRNFVQRLIKAIVDWVKSFEDWIKKFLDWLEKWWTPTTPKNNTSSSIGNLNAFLYAGLAFIILGALYFVLKNWGRITPISQPAKIVTPTVQPDLTSHEVIANELPEDGWAALAQEMIEKGEFRLALRAFYLCTLAHLETRKMISIEKYKSNHDYSLELRRRAASKNDLLQSFRMNLLLFEKVWYGTHQAHSGTIQEFLENLNRIRRC